MSEVQDYQHFHDLISTFCRGDKDAIRLCEDYLHVAHIYDDFIDLDKGIDPVTVNKTFCAVLGDIPRNPIYQEYVREFSALSLIAANTYRIANTFESGNPDELIGSFCLRNSLIMLVYFIVLLSGCRNNDANWGIEIGEVFFREFFKGYHDKYMFFLEEMKIKNNNNTK